jgi:hypothetical protein
MGGLNAYSTTCPRSRSSWLAVHPLLQKLNSAAQNAQNRAPYERDTPVLLCILLPGACVFTFMYSRACRPRQEGPYDLGNGLVLLSRSRNAPTGMLLTVFENDLHMGAARWACSGHRREVHACPTAYIWGLFCPIHDRPRDLYIGLVLPTHSRKHVAVRRERETERPCWRPNSRNTANGGSALRTALPAVPLFRSRSLGPTTTASARELWPFRVRFAHIRRRCRRGPTRAAPRRTRFHICIRFTHIFHGFI